MRKFCTILATLALVVLCVALLPTQAQAAEITSGTCGDNLTWTLDDAGTLTISGNGAIPNYYPGMYTPWMDYAESVTSIVIKDGVTNIGYGAFSGFAELKKVTIPVSVTNIGAQAFANCSNLAEVIYCGTETQWSAVSVGSGNTNILNVLRIMVAKGTCGTNLTWTLDNAGTLTISGTGAMKNYDDDYPNAPWYYRGSSIKMVVIEDGVISIGSYAFYDCISLTSITIPDSVTNIGTYAFNNCSKLTYVNITDLEAWCKISFSNSYANPLYYAKNLYLNGKLVTDIVIPDGVTSIGDCAFYNCTSLTSITLPDGMTSIGDSAFYGCSDLASVTIPDRVIFIDQDAFDGCSKLIYNAYGNGKYLGNADNPYVCLYRLQSDYCDLIIPHGVKFINPDAFVKYYDMDTLKCVTLGSVHISSIAEWCNISFGTSEYIVWDYGLGELPWETEIVYGNPLCYASNLYINGKLVTELVIPEGVTEIKDYAFMECSKLSSVGIPTSVTSIGESAFAYCSGLKNVYYCGTDEQWNKIAIGTNNSNLTKATRTHHAWNVLVTKKPTYIALGEQVSSCSLCGAEKESETIPAKFYGTSVELGNTLDMYFGFYTGLVDENGTVKFVREFADGTTETTEAPITSFKKNNSVYDITYTGLAAKEMCDTIHVYVYNGEGTLVGQHSDSIRSYILRQLREKDYGQEFRTLCVDLLNYGAAAQVEFGYRENDLANKDLTPEELAEGTQIVAAYTNKQAVKGNTAAYYGTAYLLETKISMTMAVRGSYFGNGCYALVSYTDHTGTEKSNIRLEGKKNNSVYEFVLNEIVVADGRCLLTIEFYKADGTKVLTVQDSMESYTARNADIYPLAEKMLAFSDSAYTYLHRNDK